MDFTVALLGLAGAIALFLWGTLLALSGAQRALVPRLRQILGQTLSIRSKAFFSGIGLTLLLQSSTATCLMAASFPANGMVDLLPAMAVMLGANVGTALIVQVLAFDIALASPVLVLKGFLMFRRTQNAIVHDLGRALIGLGLMLLALLLMLGILSGVESQLELRTAIGIVAAVPALGFILAAIAAWGVHSSVAVVLLIISLASRGALPLDVAFISVLGANLGTAINPLLEAGAATPEARRLPTGNLGNRIVGIALTLLADGTLAQALGGAMSLAHAVAAFHLVCNLIFALLILPLLKPAEARLFKVLPSLPTSDPASPLYLV